ncbi:MAG: hypothetical protein LQ341_003919 [Variospora aurantia]|nr:MAG: hypothetical protein LQ341_003919 [Variospora aurantia]
MERRVPIDESAWPLRRPKLVDDKEHPFNTPIPGHNKQSSLIRDTYLFVEARIIR